MMMVREDSKGYFKQKKENDPSSDPSPLFQEKG